MRLLTVEQVASRYGVPPKTVRGWAQKHSIPHLQRAGVRRIYFREDWLDEWDNGAELEIVKARTPQGKGKIGERLVRPKHSPSFIDPPEEEPIRQPQQWGAGVPVKRTPPSSFGGPRTGLMRFAR